VPRSCPASTADTFSLPQPPTLPYLFLSFQVGFYCKGGFQDPAPVREPCAAGFTTAQPASGDASACVPFCQAGYYSSNGSLPCTPCGSDFFCEGGPQTGAGIREECPDGTFTSTTTSSSAGQCQTCAVGTPPTCTVTTCAPGYYAATPSSECTVCEVGYTCPGGPQTTPLRTQCVDGLTTLTSTASATSECIRVCPKGQYAPTRTAPCTDCLTPYYCPGGSQADGPVRNPCPLTPPPGYTTLTDTAGAQSDCVIVCEPGYYSAEPYVGKCVECGLDNWCAGGPQLTPVRESCGPGEILPCFFFSSGAPAARPRGGGHLFALFHSTPASLHLSIFFSFHD
jgi:hypothetical protein